MAGTILINDFGFYPGIFTELNPVELPITTLLMAKGVELMPQKDYTYTFHSNPDMLSVTPTNQGDMGTVNFGSTGFTTGSNTMNVWFEGAAHSWARMGDQNLGRQLGWQGPSNASREEVALARAMSEALLRIKTQAEYIAREGAYNSPSNGGSGTWQQRGYRKAPGITNVAATGGVAGAGTLGTYGTLDIAVLQSVTQTLWDNKVNKSDQLYLFTNSTGKLAVSNLYRDTYNAGKYNASLTESGLNIDQFYTDFGIIKVVLTHTIPKNELYLLNLNQMRMVGHSVPGKGFMFETDASLPGVAYEAKGIYTEMGVDHGSGSCHARIYGVGSTVKGGQTVSAT